MIIDVKWTVLSPTYLGSSNSSKRDRVTWVNFFERIGVKQGIVVEKVEVKIVKVVMYVLEEGGSYPAVSPESWQLRNLSFNIVVFFSVHWLPVNAF